MTLTGRFNFRKSRTGKIILQVEEERRPLWSFSSRGQVRHRWRDARSLDLALPALRSLVELRDHAQESPQASFASLAGWRAGRRWDPEMRPELLPATGPGPERDRSRRLTGAAHG